jgi:chromosomal replication initiation ATPase DnaA
VLDGRYRFENFVVGPSNRLAVSASRAVAEAPGRVYHPLFLYAEPGLGKTHLLAAIGVHARSLDPELVVEYLAAEEFAEQLEAAVQSGELNAWRRQRESLRLFLLDDIQFLDKRGEAQAELLRLIDHGQARGNQLVLASDRPPAELDGLDQRLLSRMSGGLIVDIAAPEYETRRAILRLWREARGVDIGDDALDEMARHDAGNVRELLGLFVRVLAQRSMEPGTPAAGLARVAVAQARDEHLPDEFESFLNEVAAVVSSSVDQWRVRLAASIARWAGEGYGTTSLERYLDVAEPPDLDAVESAYGAAITQLRDLEQEAARLDARLAGIPVFRDPERLDEARAIVMRALAAYAPPPAPAHHLTIASFTSGARNQLALRAAGEVIALPGARYNPLFVHGPSSSGKSHLVHAIGNALGGRDHGAWTVAVVDAAAFGDELVEAMRTGELDRWRMRYRAADALLVDNVQLLAGNDRLQDEVFQLFNAFIEQGRQIVLTADAPPTRLSAIASRLQSRFESGLVVEIGRVSEAEAVARHTPVPAGDEAAAPTIDAWFDDMIPETPRPVARIEVPAVDSFFLDPEKVVTEWPAMDGRIVEDPR